MEATDYLGSKKQCGYTIAELLVTVGVLAILVALTLPTVATRYRLKQKLDCQATVIDFLRAQDLYYLDNKRFWKAGPGFPWERTIGWTAGSRPDQPEKYLFPSLGVEFPPHMHRGIRIRVWEINTPTLFHQELSFEVQTDENFNNTMPDPELYSYRKYNYATDTDPGTKGEWVVLQNTFWFDIPEGL